MRHRQCLSAVSMLLLAPAGVAAQGPAAPPKAVVQQLFVAPGGEAFRAPPGAAYPVAAWFAAADADADGRLTQAEFLADAERYFQRLDVDGTAVLDGAEVERYEREMLPEMSRTHPSRRPPRTPGSEPPKRPSRNAPELPRGAGLFGLIDSPHPVKAADQDMDSKVTRAEYKAILIRRFAFLDKTGSGALTLADLPPTPIQTLSGDLPAPRKAR